MYGGMSGRVIFHQATVYRINFIQMKRRFRPVGRGGGFEGVRSNPLLTSKKDLLYMAQLYILPFESGSLVSLLFRRITAVLTSLVAGIYASLFVKDQRETRGSCCHERTRVNNCVNRSLLQALEI